ncbi:GrdX family protein [Thermosyntropha sp.]|uniref:GrdX family protein n=1 Tax=Thermosyntropha sp. TaxID=2740820 RepID=UPI0025E0E491|nr:GrdX family protein [Thermosyntropha sp.]MBO8159516.1 GrdX family protein [Thermosyntropha sp.]
MRQDELLIITNNPLVKNIDRYEICWIDGNPEEVYYKTLNFIGLGHKLLSHPLAGSIKPNQNPYRSIVVTKNSVGAADEDLKIINQCLEKVENMALEATRPDLKVNYAEDFQLVDKELLLNALASLLER